MLGKTEGNRRRGWQRIRWLDSIMDSMDTNLRKLQETVENRGAWNATVHGVTKSQTRLSDYTTNTKLISSPSTESLLIIAARRQGAGIH